MLRAEKAMRKELARESLADVARTLDRKAPSGFSNTVQDWFAGRAKSRSRKRSVRDRAS
jgi:hypothetical protein